MKCPRCLKREMEQDMEMESAICPLCEYEIDTDNFIDPAVLLGLIEKAQQRDVFMGHLASRSMFRARLLDSIKSYLSGDHKPLKKLAGVE